MWRDAIFFLSISSSLSASSCSSFTTGYPVDKELNWKNVLFSHPLHLLFLLLLQAFYHILIAIYSGSCSKYYRLNTVWQVSEQLVTADCTRKFVTTHLIMHRVAPFYFFISILHQNETTSVFLIFFFIKLCILHWNLFTWVNVLLDVNDIKEKDSLMLYGFCILSTDKGIFRILLFNAQSTTKVLLGETRSIKSQVKLDSLSMTRQLVWEEDWRKWSS